MKFEDSLAPEHTIAVNSKFYLHCKDLPLAGLLIDQVDVDLAANIINFTLKELGNAEVIKWIKKSRQTSPDVTELGLSIHNDKNEILFTLTFLQCMLKYHNMSFAKSNCGVEMSRLKHRISMSFCDFVINETANTTSEKFEDWSTDQEIVISKEANE